MTEAKKPVPNPPRAGVRRIQPLYHQIQVQLRHLLTETALDITKPLPSEPTLAKRYGVSRVTIRTTLDRLQSEGLITRVHGKGTFPTRSHGGQGTGNISSMLDNLLSFEPRTRATILEWGMVDADAAIARQLGSKRCLRIVRLRTLGETPISFTTVYVPSRYAKLLDKKAVGDEPIVRALDQKGISAQQAEQIISAMVAPDEMARRLHVEVGSPLVVMRRLFLDDAHAPVLHQESRYPPDRFEYRMTLSRLSVGPVGQWSPTS
jgi:GntR family transcriptional regulator